MSDIDIDITAYASVKYLLYRILSYLGIRSAFDQVDDDSAAGLAVQRDYIDDALTRIEEKQT